VPGLSTNKNLNLNSPDVGVADVQRTVISEVKRYGMSQVPPEARKIIGQIENQFKIINRPSGSARQPQFLNNLISDSSTPGDDILGFKL
jgi:ethanolamine ammonia-lyase small subunit